MLPGTGYTLKCTLTWENRESVSTLLYKEFSGGMTRGSSCRAAAWWWWAVALSVLVLAPPSPCSARPADPGEWSVADVSDWAGRLPGLSEAVRADLTASLRREAVSGAVLLYLDEEALREDLGVVSSLQRKILLAAIDDLVKSSIDDPSSLSEASAASFSSPPSTKDTGACSLTFYELREQDRKLFDQLPGLLSTAPRGAISLVPRLPEHAQPASPFRTDFPMNWIVWFFVPEYYLWKNAPTTPAACLGYFHGSSRQHDTGLVELIRALAPAAVQL